MIPQHLKQLTKVNRVEPRQLQMKCHSAPPKNKMKLNEAKCKELRISFSKVPRDFNPILLIDKCVKVVESCKILSMVINNKLTWDLHINQVVKVYLNEYTI